MRSNIRTLTQTDSTELPDALVDMMLSESLQHCSSWTRYWPFYRNSWSVSLLAADYDITLQNLIDPAASGATTAYHFMRLNQITSVIDTTNDVPLKWVTWDELIAMRETTTSSATGPICWSFSNVAVADTINLGYVSPWLIYIFPTPTDAVTIRIDGYRDPIDWVTALDGGTSDVGGYIAAGEPDMPHPFHPAIQNFAVGLALAYLDEGDRSMFYMALADNILRQQQEIWLSTPQSGAPLIVGGDGTSALGQLPSRLRYPWEV